MEITDFIPDGPKVGVNVKIMTFRMKTGSGTVENVENQSRSGLIQNYFIKQSGVSATARQRNLRMKKDDQEYEEEMRRVQRLKDASMMDDKYRKASFSSYMVREENKKAFQTTRAYVRDFQTMIKDGHPKTGEKNIGLVFYGKVGTGKSYTAACIANALMEMKVSVIMTSFVKILQDIQSREDEANYISVLNGCKLLIIDDLGAERNTDYALEKVYNVIDSRARADKPMILTTNLSFDEMMRNPDIRYRRIYDRIFETCIPVEMPGNSFRIMRAAQRQKQLEHYYDSEE